MSVMEMFQQLESGQVALPESIPSKNKAGGAEAPPIGPPFPFSYPAQSCPFPLVGLANGSFLPSKGIDPRWAFERG